MPADRLNHNGRTPITPRLAPSVAAAKTSSITPRLATSVTSVSANSSQSGRSVRSNVSSTPRANTSSHEDLSTPVKSFLSNNITPRSSSRKSRVGVSSANSTPTGTPSGTPAGTRPASVVDFPPKEQAHGYSGLGINGLNSAQSASRPRSIVSGNGSYNTTPTPRPPIANIYGGTSEVGGARDGSPMFFHASEARTHEPPAPPPKKAPVFFYANGQQDESLKAAEVPSPPLSSVGRALPESKFFHAASLSEARGGSPTPPPPPDTTSPEPWNVNSTQRAPTLRPPSPSKENIHLSYRKGASQVIRPNLHSRPSALSIISGHVQTPIEGQRDRTRRRSSAASSTFRLGHAKSTSLSSIDSVSSLRKVASHDLPTITSSPLQNEKRVISNSSIPESVQSEPTPPKEVISGLPSPQLQSPTKPNGDQSVLERMNELAANARRERKVLDLEISNSSLLAINRQLEKEVRKQKTELRRFRRMSRAGRFSTDTIISDIPEYSVDGIADLSDMDEELDSFNEDQLSSSESSIDEGALSPNALAERDAAYRLRDEKRLRLDLSKHRELLIDSQKMNQSLKRCMNWTEELIKDAQKALAYNVRPSDVKLGGRVLTEEEHPEPESTEESRSLLSPWTPTHTTLDPLESLSFPGSERTDRDSGVDLDGQKPAVLKEIEDLLSETPSRPRRSIGDVY